MQIGCQLTPLKETAIWIVLCRARDDGSLMAEGDVQAEIEWCGDVLLRRRRMATWKWRAEKKGTEIRFFGNVTAHMSK